MIKDIVKSIGKSIYHLYSPDICMGCDELTPINGQAFCLTCYAELPVISSPAEARAALTGKPHIPGNITNIWSSFYFSKDGIIQHLIHKTKYYSDKNVAYELGKILGKTIGDDILKYELLPVPIHQKRLRQRGYNQSYAIAEGIASVVDHQVNINSSLLLRTDDRMSQSQKDKTSRKELLLDSFKLGKLSSSEKKYLLIDDVITTGATIAACMFALKKGGVSDVDVATVAISI